MKTRLLFLLVSFFSSAIYAQSTNYSSTKGIAIKGYDAVAYFELQKAIEGSKEFTFEWSGSKWRFVSQANLENLNFPLKNTLHSMAATVLMVAAKIIYPQLIPMHGQLQAVNFT